MKEFLFLFPVKAYIEDGVFPRIQRLKPRSRSKLFYINDIINARYRSQGFTINWLMFQPSDDKCSEVSEFIHIQPQDRFLDSGITAEQTSPPLYAHANPDNVLSQLLQPIDELILGGFHQDDCVDKIASFAYQTGIKTFIDEDTTEHFFNCLALGRKIPVIRTNWNLRALGVDKNWLDFVRQHRVNQPWLTQN